MKFPILSHKNAAILLLSLFLALESCHSGTDYNQKKVELPGVAEVSGYKISADSIKMPESVEAGAPYIVSVGQLKETIAETNIKLAGKPETLLIGKPVTKVVGSDSTLKPLITVPAEKPVFCKAPEQILAKDAYIKDINPHNFSSYSKLQGLRHDQVRALIEDNLGNLWLGTDDGLTRFDGKYFSHYTTEQGLNNNLILSLIQDSKGNIWFGTFRGGVTRYDGMNLTTFSVESGLPSDIVNSIFEDNTGKIWFGTGGGVSVYDGKYITTYTKDQGLSGIDVRAINQDSAGRIWIASNGGGLSVFDGKSFTCYTEKDGFANNFTSALYRDKAGNMWIGATNSGIIKFDGSSFIHYTKQTGLGSNSIRTILEDNSGNMWFGTTDAGLTKFDGKFFHQFNMKEGLGSDYIRSSLQDSNGNIWFGTRMAGLTRYEGNKFTHMTENEGLSNNRVMNILEDNEGKMWFATFGGYATVITSKEIDSVKRKVIKVFGREEGLRSSRIYSILQDHSGNIWFGTDGGGVTMFDGKKTYTYTKEQGLADDAIRTVFQDNDGKMWFATYGSGISIFDGKRFTNFTVANGLSSNNILSMFQDSRGVIWLGTDGGGVMTYKNDTLTHFTTKQNFFSNTVYSIAEDKHGDIWLGTGGEGLVRYDGKKFTRYAEESGLNNNHVLSMIIGKYGNIWAGTRFGLNFIHYQDISEAKDSLRPLHIASYNFEDGFIGIGCNLDAIGGQSDGTMWIGTTDRLTAYHGKKDKQKSVEPNLQITGLQLFHEDIPWSLLNGNKDTSLTLHNGVKVGKLNFSSISRWYGLPKDLKLSYKHNYLSFNYIGITQSQINKVVYDYMLEGLDKRWSAHTTRTEATYGNLSPGKYTFKVRVISQDGTPGKEVSYKFSIRPPWWKTWTFYVILAGFIVFLIFMLIRQRERSLKYDKQLLEKKVSEQTSELTQKNQELQMTNLEKDKLFSIIAHDLRGPFSSFLGLTQIMSEELSSFTMDEIKSFAENMNNSARHLFSLLENLLQWSRMQQGAISFRPQSVLLSSVTHDNMGWLTQSAQEKEITLTINIPKDMSVVADINMLQTVIRNLVSNAIKFTPKGGKVTLSARDARENIEISVKDSGIGMNDEIQSNLFKLKTAIGRSGTEGEPSTGLGLMICKELVELHGGEIVVISSEGKGSEFIVKIPVR